jgi:DNA-directed RNA polymerase sigma subunit (sigma70/sigma32)
MSLGEVGSVLGLTRERVRQLEEDAMQKVADLLKSKDIDTLIGAFTHRTGPE